MIEINYNEYKETIADNMKLIQENHKLKEIIKEVREYIETNKLIYLIILKKVKIMGKKMSNWLSTGKFNEKDEYYTPPILVKPILKYLKSNSTIWCPFDTEDSEFVIMLRGAGHKVIYSHIWEGKDFFEYEPSEDYDYIISNPPFTKKLKVFERLYNLGKPFAMVSGLPILNYQEIGEFFLDKELQLLIVDKKVSFDGNTASFNNSYFCYKVLPRDIMFEHLEHNNTKDNFIGSRMKYRGEDDE